MITYSMEQILPFRIDIISGGILGAGRQNRKSQKLSSWAEVAVDVPRVSSYYENTLMQIYRKFHH